MIVQIAMSGPGLVHWSWACGLCCGLDDCNWTAKAASCRRTPNGAWLTNRGLSHELPIDGLRLTSNRKPTEKHSVWSAAAWRLSHN